jgi:hypothetical protein
MTTIVIAALPTSRPTTKRKLIIEKDGLKIRVLRTYRKGFPLARRAGPRTAAGDYIRFRYC